MYFLYNINIIKILYMMIIPHDFQDDLIDYIYSFIIYNKKK